MSSVLVTAMYNGLSDTEYGGRNRDKMYLDSLKSLNDMHHPILCFVNPKDHLYNKWKFEELNMQYITRIPFDIFSQDFSGNIIQIKNKYPEIYKNGDDIWKHRCVELMWSKTRMISTAIRMMGESIDNVFWIDAGLSNSSIIRHKYFKNIGNGDFYSSQGLFIPRFVFNLVKHSQGKILSIRHTQPHNYPIPEKFNKNKYNDNYSMIGGLFGGNIEYMNKFCSIFEEYITKLLINEELYSEESIYTGIHNDNIRMFTDMTFDTFYHQNWEEYDQNQVAFTSIIEKFIETEEIHDKR